jgi:hypothetical protein
MNKTKFMQTDSRWGGLGYPKKPWYIRNCGCGEVSIANCIIEMEQYKNYTPATIQPYCKQYAAPNGDGTYWSGIPKMMSHYGLTEVKEHATMAPLWKELAKGNRVAIYLMGSRRGGSKGVHWTSGGHFVCSVDYKYQNGKHYVYVKDSYSNSSLRNGWISYEENMRNDVLKVWSGKLNSKKPSAPTTTPTDSKLAVDGIGGLATVQRLQEFLGLSKTDGITIRKDLQKYVPALKAYDYGTGSPTVKAMQKWLGLSDPDGLWGSNTSKGLQKKLGVTQDGIFGVNSMKALQKYLNEHDKAVYPEKSKGEKIMDACKAQANYMKSAKYGDYSPVTLAHSKSAGTCVTYEGCVFQRLGALASGKYIWHDGKGYGTGKVTHLNTKTMTCTYMHNKTLASLKGKIQKGDCILVDDNKSGKAGSGGHVFFCTGEWSGNDPYVWDFEPNRTCAKTGKPRKYSGSRKVLAIVRTK